MFSRKSCYFFVRPRRNFLELCIFLARTVKAPQIRRVDRASKSKSVHIIRVTHRDEVERFPFRPSRVVDSIADLIDELE